MFQGETWMKSTDLTQFPKLLWYATPKCVQIEHSYLNVLPKDYI